MRYLMIENRGEIELNALVLMGASTKRAQDKIGVFGTGTKYALAALLAESTSPTIFSGPVKIEFVTQPTTLRNEEYNQVVLLHDGKYTPLGFTTSMGLNWGVKEALRELVSNAMDEEEYSAEMVEEMVGRNGYTRIYVPATDDVVAFFWNLPRMFCRLRKHVAEFKCGWQGEARIYEPHEPHGVRVYRKGVLVYENDQMTSAFDYDISWLNVHEDRRCGLWEVQYALSTVLDQLTVHQKVRVLKLIMNDEVEESKILEAQLNSELSSLEWKEAIEYLSPLSEPMVMSASASEATHQKWAAVSLPEKWAANLTNSVIQCRGPEKMKPSKPASVSKLVELVMEHLPDAYLREMADLDDADYERFASELKDSLSSMKEYF